MSSPIAQLTCFSMTRDVREVKDQHGNTVTLEEGPKGIQAFLTFEFPNGREEQLEVSTTDMRRLQAAAGGITVAELEKMAGNY